MTQSTRTIVDGKGGFTTVRNDLTNGDVVTTVNDGKGNTTRTLDEPSRNRVITEQSHANGTSTSMTKDKTSGKVIESSEVVRGRSGEAIITNKDGEGRITKATTETPNGLGGTNSRVVATSYDNHGHANSTITTQTDLGGGNRTTKVESGDGKLLSTSTTVKDSTGRSTSTETDFKTGRTNTSVYDEKKGTYSVESRDKKGNLVSTVNSARDKDGNINATTTDGRGKITKTTSVTLDKTTGQRTETVKDGQGKLISSKTYSSDDKIVSQQGKQQNFAGLRLGTNSPGKDYKPFHAGIQFNNQKNQHAGNMNKNYGSNTSNQHLGNMNKQFQNNSNVHDNLSQLRTRNGNTGAFIQPKIQNQFSSNLAGRHGAFRHN
jgi:hypothetical protein